MFVEKYLGVRADASREDVRFMRRSLSTEIGRAVVLGLLLVITSLAFLTADARASTVPPKHGFPPSIIDPCWHCLCPTPEAQADLKGYGTRPPRATADWSCQPR